MLTRGAFVGCLVIAPGRRAAQEQSRCPAGSEMVGMMVPRTVRRPGLPWFDCRIGDLQFRLTPRPQGLQDDGVCLFADQPPGSTAVRFIEKGNPMRPAVITGRSGLVMWQ